MEGEKKCGFCGKLLRFALWGIVGLSVLVVVLAAALPLWIGPVVAGVAGKVVPGLTGTDFSIERFSLNPYSGTLGIEGVRLANPKGFGDSAAVSFSRFSIELSVGSVFSDTVVVRDVTIEDAFASYYSHKGTNNFDAICKNMGRATGPNAEKKPKTVEPKSASSQKKVVIDRLRVSGTKIKLAKSDMVPAVVIPAMELRDIGKKSGGATLGEAWAQIVNSTMKSASTVADGLGALGGILGDGAKGISGAVKDSGAGAAKNTVDAVGDTTRKAAESIKGLFKGLDK